MGIGVVYAKNELMDDMRPYQGGGDMIDQVSFDGTTYAKGAQRFEAGTPNIEGAIGLGAAIDYLNSFDRNKLLAYENELLSYATDQLDKIDGIQFYGQAKNKASVISFLIKGIHPYDIGTIIDKLGIAVRTGHHCAQPIMTYYNIPGTIRASFAFYNTKKEIDKLVTALKKAVQMLS